MTPEEYRKKPVFKTDFDKPVLNLFKEIQNDLINSKRNIIDIIYGYPNYKNNLNHIKGLLTCGLSCLHTEKQKIMDNKIKQADDKYGKSISFKLCGIGIDYCSCFICGGNRRMISNISAFVKSKNDGEEIVKWFGQGAYLNYDSCDNLNYVKIGACAEHLPNLKKLDELTYNQYNVLRKHTIKEAKGLLNESKK